MSWIINCFIFCLQAIGREKCKLSTGISWNSSDANIVSLQLCIFDFIMNEPNKTNLINCQHIAQIPEQEESQVCEQVFRHTHSLLFKNFVELAIVIASTNSFFNPLIYLQCSTEFRAIVRKVFKQVKLKFATRNV